MINIKLVCFFCCVACVQISHSEERLSLATCLSFLGGQGDWTAKGADSYYEGDEFTGGFILVLDKEPESPDVNLHQESISFYIVDEFQLNGVEVVVYDYVFKGEEGVLGTLNDSRQYLRVYGKGREFSREFLVACKDKLRAQE